MILWFFDFMLSLLSNSKQFLKCDTCLRSYTQIERTYVVATSKSLQWWVWTLFSACPDCLLLQTYWTKQIVFPTSLCWVSSQEWRPKRCDRLLPKHTYWISERFWTVQKFHLTKLSYFRIARQLKFFISMPLFTELISHKSFVAEVQHICATVMLDRWKCGNIFVFWVDGLLFITRTSKKKKAKF